MMWASCAPIAELQANLAFDPVRIYATGMPNSSMLSYRLAAEASDLFAAVVPVAGTIGGTFRSGWGPHTNTPQDGPLSISGDQRDAGCVCGGIFGNDRVENSAATSISASAAHNQCVPEPVTTITHKEMVITNTYTCPEGIDVVLVSIVDGEHAWPGSVHANTARPSVYFEASDLILRFFLAQAR